MSFGYCHPDGIGLTFLNLLFSIFRHFWPFGYKKGRVTVELPNNFTFLGGTF